MGPESSKDHAWDRDSEKLVIVKLENIIIELIDLKSELTFFCI